MKDQEFLCYCCCISPKDRRNLKCFDEEYKTMYKEFTGNEVTLDLAKICVSCKESLINSSEFLNLCKSSYSKFNECIQKEIEISEIPSENIIFTVNAIEEESQDDADDQIEFDQEDEIPISNIKKQLESSRIYEVIEFKNIEEAPKESKLSLNKKPGEKRYMCDYPDCGMRFAQANALKCHKRTHTKERPYICSFCSKSFSQNTTLKTHIVAKHTGKSLECTIEGCSKKFSRSSFLKQHIKRDHESLRDYTCLECDKSYKQKSHLDRHVQATHQNIRHECNLCEKSFSKSWSLKMHQFSHSKVQDLPYKCSLCSINFHRRDKWLKHMNKEHPDVEIDLNPIEIAIPKVE